MSSEAAAAPIVSTLAGDSAQFERLERFVVALGERIDRLQDLESGRDHKQLEAEARSLGFEATQLGYPELAEAAADVAHACAVAAQTPHAPTLHAPTPRAASPIRASLIALTDVSRRVRLGHRFVEI